MSCSCVSGESRIHVVYECEMKNMDRGNFGVGRCREKDYVSHLAMVSLWGNWVSVFAYRLHANCLLFSRFWHVYAAVSVLILSEI